ncbi:hypothetical protein QWJ34_05945 [Saccharibacillus sp. CPCC 101409]|uniref:hypothetical protein n=1 Tax=Saccharibacillus sp. CPCC 101409 TaxID=3058041 RepID=UPI00267345A6|nr:hypothetical protein [Saccharibacillus sp. CPCC 101409]MDO3409297.1 hypothetical protein [Saccharibacillus sp. CPCC 101409]
MKHWVGRKVVVDNGGPYQTKRYGTLIRWNDKEQYIVLSPGGVRIAMKDIMSIREIEILPQESRQAAGRPNSIGYIVKTMRQFEHAVLFRSAMMIWEGDRLLAAKAHLIKHNDQTVTLEDGTVLVKKEYLFVVRSFRG